MNFLWRIHRELLRERVPEVVQVIEALGDHLELIDGRTPPLPLAVPPDAPGLALTTLQDASRLCKDPSWINPKLLYWDRQKYNVTHWMPQVRDIPVLNDDMVFVPAGLLVKLADHAGFSRSTKWFLRPDSGLKSFTGFCIEDSWEAIHRELTVYQKVSPTELVGIASAKELGNVEWRFWIVNRTVVAHSPYSWSLPVGPNAGEQVPQHAMSIANQMARNQWQPDISYVVDVAESKGRYFLNEINAASTSGLYQAHLSDLFGALRSAVLAEVAGDISIGEF